MSDSRGDTIDMPPWWNDEAAEVITKVGDAPRSDLQYRVLGERLAAHVKRATPWKRETLQRTIRGKFRWTTQLVEALHKEFPDLPRALFLARDYQEAAEMTNVQHKTDRRLMSDVERKRPASPPPKPRVAHGSAKIPALK